MNNPFYLWGRFRRRWACFTTWAVMAYHRGRNETEKCRFSYLGSRDRFLFDNNVWVKTPVMDGKNAYQVPYEWATRFFEGNCRVEKLHD